MKKAVNPLMQPFKKMLKVCTDLDAIPGFSSDTLKKTIAEAKTAIINEVKPKAKCTPTKKR